MALREHYAERFKALMSGDRRALEAIRGITLSVEPDLTKVEEIKQVAAPGVRTEDEWALQYISISRIQPLLEAFDGDASSLVSITEVNAFTASRPKDWR